MEKVMHSQETIIATRIWPQHMGVKEFTLEQKRQEALKWLGGRYLLAYPINRRSRG